MAVPGESYPRTGFLLSVIGGALILGLSALEISILTLDRSQVAALGYSGSIVATATGGVIFASLMGVGVLVLALRIRSRPAATRRSGIGVILLSVVSIFGGGGLFVGALLGIIGGALAYGWKPSSYGAPSTAMGGPFGGAPSAALPSPTPPLSGPGRLCPFCGAANPTSAQFCAQCGGRFPR